MFGAVPSRIRCRFGHLLPVRQLSNSCNELNLPKDLLNAFPDLNSVIKFRNEGKYFSAIDIISRNHEILVNVTGKDSDSSSCLFELLLNFYYQSGQLDKIEKSMKNWNDEINNNKNINSTIQNLLILASSKLQTGDIQNAKLIVDKLISICENNDKVALDKIPQVYGLKGLIHLLINDLDESETFLQLSARWSQSKNQEILSLTNLGFLHMSKDDGKNLLQKDQLDFSTSPIAKLNNKSSLSAKDESNLKVGMEYWNEAINNFNKDNLSNNVASAMCGEKNSNILSPDGSVSFKTVSETKTVEVKSQNQTVNEITAYSGLLCNLAEANILLGNIQESGNCLESALKYLTEETERNNIVSLASPSWFRVFGLLAYVNMFNSNAVTAEGLFRASLDRLRKNPQFFTFDKTRNDYEIAVVKGRLGLLFSKWDKREQQSLEMINESKKILSSQPQFSSGLYLTNSIPNPVQFYLKKKNNLLN